MVTLLRVSLGGGTTAAGSASGCRTISPMRTTFSPRTRKMPRSMSPNMLPTWIRSMVSCSTKLAASRDMHVHRRGPPQRVSGPAAAHARRQLGPGARGAVPNWSKLRRMPISLRPSRSTTSSFSASSTAAVSVAAETRQLAAPAKPKPRPRLRTVQLLDQRGRARQERGRHGATRLSRIAGVRQRGSSKWRVGRRRPVRETRVLRHGALGFLLTCLVVVLLVLVVLFVVLSAPSLSCAVLVLRPRRSPLRVPRPHCASAMCPASKCPANKCPRTSAPRTSAPRASAPPVPKGRALLCPASSVVFFSSSFLVCRKNNSGRRRRCERRRRRRRRRGRRGGSGGGGRAKGPRCNGIPLGQQREMCRRPCKAGRRGVYIGRGPRPDPRCSCRSKGWQGTRRAHGIALRRTARRKSKTEKPRQWMGRRDGVLVG